MDKQPVQDFTETSPEWSLPAISAHVLENLPDLFSIVSVPDYRYVLLNALSRYLLAIDGIDSDETIGRTPWDIHPELEEPLRAIFDEVRNTAEPRQLRDVRLEARGAVSYWDFRLIPHLDSRGEVYAISNISSVVTDRKLSTDALEQSAEEISEVLESITDGFVALDREYRYTYVNRNAEKLLQHSREQLLGKRIWDISPGALGSGLHNACEKALSKQVSASLEHYSTRFDAWFENHIYPRRDGVSIFFSDITGRRRREELGSALNGICAALSSSLDADEILNHALVESSKVLRAETAAINLLEGDTWTVHNVYGLSSDWIGVQYSSQEAGVSWEVARTGKIVTVTDAAKDPRVDRQSVETYGIRAVLAVPLTLQGRVAGVMKFRYLSPRKAFTGSEMDFATKLASSVSLALQNARLVSDLQAEVVERTEREVLSSALNTINAAVNSTMDFEEIMNRALLESAQALHADSAVINLKQDDHWVIHYTYGVSVDSLVSAYSGDHSRLADLAAETGKLLAISDTAADERINRRVTDELGIRSVLVVPLTLHDEVVGVMKFRYGSPRQEFSKAQMDFAEKLSVSVSLALHNSRLVSDLHTEISERTEREKLSDALNKINADITSALEAEAIMYKAIVQAAEALGADMAAVNLREDDHWVIGCIHGLPEDVRGNRFSGERAKLSELVAATGQVQAIADVATDPRIDNSAVERYGIRSVLALPLTLRNSVIGIIAFRYKKQRERFSEAEIDFAKKLGVSVSLALENARLVGSLVSEVEERKSREELSSALNTIHEAINSTLDFDEIMSRALHESARALRADTAAINLKEGDHWRVGYTYGSPPELAGFRFSGTRAPVSNLVAEVGDIVTIDDILTDGRVDKDELQQYGIRGIMAAPLILRGELVGVIVFRFLEPRDSFPESAVDFLAKLASAVTLALENARLFTDLQEEMEERNRVNERLSTVLDSITDAYYALDSEWRFVEVNDVAERSLFGKSAEELAGRTCWEVYPQTENSVYHEQMRRALEENQPVHFEAESILRDKWWEVHVYPRDGRLEVYLRDITDRRKADERLRNHLHLLQQALLPPKPTICDGYALASAYVPAFRGEEIGGDFYDVFRTDEGKTAILIGDVSGKGIEAAALASAARNTVRAFAHEPMSPGDALGRTNTVLTARPIAAHRFVTLFLAIIDPESGEMHYSSAGHPPALLYRPGGTMDFLSCGNMPVGLTPGETYRELKTRIAPGDKLILYTDGITDVRSDAQMLGIHGIERVVRHHADSTPQDLVTRILDTAKDWAHGQTSDDMAVIVMERLRETLGLIA